MMDLIIDHVLIFYVNGMGKLDANDRRIREVNELI
jgi:hypothetical protein